MRSIFAILCLLGLLLYVGQLISVASFSLAQRLGLQESPEYADPLSSLLELWAARWDLLWLWTLPAAGILMLMNHWLWPYAALIGGGAFVDAGGREAVKMSALRRGGVRTGSQREHSLAIGVFTYLVVTGLLAIAIALREVI